MKTCEVSVCGLQIATQTKGGTRWQQEARPLGAFCSAWSFCPAPRSPIRMSSSSPRTRRTGRCRRATCRTSATASSSRSTRTTSSKLQVAWTFSTGVLRGHEGSPLVIGDMMYVHTPFPNKVFAIDLDDAEDQVEVRAEAGPGGDPGRCAATPSTAASPMPRARSSCSRPTRTLVALDAKTGKVVWTVKNGDPEDGRRRTPTRRTSSRTR